MSKSSLQCSGIMMKEVAVVLLLVLAIVEGICFIACFMPELESVGFFGLKFLLAQPTLDGYDNNRLLPLYNGTVQQSNYYMVPSQQKLFIVSLT
jgi:hypothetical protein